MVNIANVDVSEEMERWKDEDKLEALFEVMREAQEEYEWNQSEIDINTKEGQEKIKKMIYYCVEELFELSNEMKQRPWAKTEYQVDEMHVRDEIADSVAFLLVIILQCGLDAEELFEIVVRKMKVNEMRRRSKY